MTSKTTRWLIFGGMIAVVITIMLLLNGCGPIKRGIKKCLGIPNIPKPVLPNLPKEKSRAETPPIAAKGLNLLMYGGVAVVLLGVGMLLLKRNADALLSMCAGAGLIVTTMFAERFPWVIYILGAGIFFFLGYVLYNSYRGKQNDIALKHIVQGIETVPAFSKEVKDNIEKVAGEKDKLVRSVVNRVKKKNGWVAPRNSRVGRG